ncbi:hypothetical protein J6590_089624 [Homalodisca vitripennis]|nr:hypothetical protein J6590_085764 [Homalodisca vitripennis]KAG8290125.1 hypothetical protein J6590_089624 [Homalodisca vitripennis]
MSQNRQTCERVTTCRDVTRLCFTQDSEGKSTLLVVLVNLIFTTSLRYNLVLSCSVSQHFFAILGLILDCFASTTHALSAFLFGHGQFLLEFIANQVYQPHTNKARLLEIDNLRRFPQGRTAVGDSLN